MLYCHGKVIPTLQSLLKSTQMGHPMSSVVGGYISRRESSIAMKLSLKKVYTILLPVVLLNKENNYASIHTVSFAYWFRQHNREIWSPVCRLFSCPFNMNHPLFCDLSKEPRLSPPDRLRLILLPPLDSLPPSPRTFDYLGA